MKHVKRLLLALAMLSSFSAYAQAAPPTATLTWDQYATGDITLFGITGFEIDRSQQPLGTTCTALLTFTKLNSVVEPQISYVDTILSLGNRMCYMVRGVNNTGVSPGSNVAGKDFPLTVPPAATGLVVK